jgi:hypothetical protein
LLLKQTPILRAFVRKPWRLGLDLKNQPNDDFFIGAWTIINRRRNNALDHVQDGVWEEFDAHQPMAKYLVGKIIIDHFKGGTFIDGVVRKGMTIRSFDPYSLCLH